MAPAHFSQHLELVELAKASVRRLVELSSRQFGVITHRDLALTGVSWKWLRGRLSTREWSRVHRGVFRLGYSPPSREEREMAALRAAGDNAVLSHTSAARKLGLDVPKEELLHLTVPASRQVKVRGAKVWRSRTLSCAEVTTRGGFRLTSLPRTMIDLAAVLDDGWLRAALDSAIRQDRSHLTRIWRLLLRWGPGRRGAGRLRSLVEEYRRGAEVPDSALEAFALRLARATGQMPKVHYEVRDRGRFVAEVDLAWPQLRLGIELDGWAYHATRQNFVKDRARDRALFQLGWSVLCYTWGDVMHDHDSFIEELAQIFEAQARTKGVRVLQLR